MQYLWEQLALTDLVYINVGLSYALVLLLLLRVPGLIGQAIAVYKNNRQQTILLQYISRFFPTKLFNLALYTLNALTSLSFVLTLLVRWSVSPSQASHQTLFLVALTCIVGYVLLLYIRSASMQVWNYLFPNLYADPLLIKQALWSLSLQIAVLKLILILPTLMVDNPMFATITFGIVCAIVVGLRSWILIHKATETNGRSYAVFLYLCTCEFVPYLYLYCIWDFIR